MHIIIYWIVVMLLSLTCVHSSLEAQQSSDAKPTCMGEFCFNVSSLGMLMTEEAFVKKYGGGYSVGVRSVYHCFKASEQNLYVRFRSYHGEQNQIIEIFVSDVPSCPSARPPKRPFEPLETDQGLRIGDPYKKVLALYGEPNIEEKASGIERIGIDYRDQLSSAPFGDTRLRYFPAKESLLGAHIYIRKGKVSAILISASP